MARTKARRTRSTRRNSQSSIPDITTVGRYLVKPEVVGTLLIVLAVASVPYLIPFTGVLGEGRNGLVELLGLHVFTLILLVAGFGLMLALRSRTTRRPRPRHIAGLVTGFVVLAGILGRWYPDVQVGDVALHSVSAGGEFGRLFAGSLWGTTAWILAWPLAFALLWPRTARTVAQEAPGTTAEVARWTWELGLHRYAWRGIVAIAALSVTAVRTVNRRLEVAPPNDDELRAAGVPIPVEGDDVQPESTSNAAAVLEPETIQIEELEPKPATQMPMDLETPVNQWRHSADGWQLPPVTMLQEPVVTKNKGFDNQRRANLIVETLASFGVDSSVVEINEGPTITQFGVEPGWDVKTRTVVERDASGNPILDANGNPKQKEVEVSRTRIRVNRITALQNDLALALAAPALRIEAPVPGKAMVGIEVPNGTTSVVSLRSLMGSSPYQKFAQKAALPVALGAGVSGDPVTADLAKMPHLLIAGATGAGKSVCLNSIITGLLMNYSPEQLRFVMVDPKRVELTAFGAIPHLAFSEIVVEMDRVVGTLQAVINEMENRYRRFAQAGVRNIERFNEKFPGHELPYWVVVIDELADLMLAAPYQVENQLVRLAQLARATGIHLIVATQRPSVDVITGLIKANFPTRIAFAVSSQVDSRTILDQSGAEKLLGKGDMLYVPPDAQKPKRVQGVYVSDEEIEAVVDFWTADRFRDLVPEKYDTELEKALEEAEQIIDGQASTGSGGDSMLAKAVEVARGSRTLSTSMLQRKLGIGYPRAARLMDLLEEQGVIGPAEGGGKSRDVLVDMDGEPIGGADAYEPASLAAHAAAFTPRAVDEDDDGPALELDASRLRAGPPRPFDAD